MRRYLFTLFVVFSTGYAVFSQHSISGKVLNAGNGSPVEFAIVTFPDKGLWTVANEYGEFTIKLGAAEPTSMLISCLGYIKTSFEINVRSDINRTYFISEDNLSIGEVVVTAQRKTEEVATSYSINRNALDHLQVLSITDVLAQLPGGQTNHANSLIQEQHIALRSQSSSELDNPGFGTAIEIDGVRLSNNSAFVTDASDGIEGIGSRNIAVNNIESIEVVTGLPSVEHGDLSSGIMKINTRKGKTPLQFEVVTKPLIKSYSFSKGFSLNHDAGVINTDFEHTRSIAQRASPYTNYTRNSLSLIYRNTFLKENHPLELTASLTGNLGGYNSEADPDAFTNTYSKSNDYVLRTGLTLNWLLNRSWITDVEISGSVNYTDKKQKEKTNKSSSSASAAIHTTEEGYFIATNYDQNPEAAITLIPSGYWFQVQYNDEKPVSYTTGIKGNWIRKFGSVNSKLKTGAELVYSGNYGNGIQYADKRYAPSWREFRYSDQPFVKNIALFAEEKAGFLLYQREFKIQAGIRSDITAIKGSEYGTVYSFSPRINVQYQLIDHPRQSIKKASIHAGWGDAVKLPSSNILYPRPSYSDKLSFAPGTLADGTVFYAYYTIPSKSLYNPKLKWQRTRKTEIGMDVHLSKAKISLTAFMDKTYHPYKSTSTYQPFSYKLTDQSALENCKIPLENRSYSIDQTSGIVIVSDQTGQYSDEKLSYITRNTFKSNSSYSNGSPVIKKGLEWVIDFGKIQLLKTNIRLDGNYYFYKGTDETIVQDLSSTANMANGNPYKYIGFFVGSSTSTNGSRTQKLTANLTLSTHIPAIRMIVSFRLESCFLDYSQSLSEYANGTRSFVIDSKDSYLPSSASTDIYAGNHYVAMYPLYYISLDDMKTPIPFAEKFIWAKENDRALYNELAKMVVKTNYDYTFNARKYSDYFSGNISLTKEIGDKVSISFQANNFFNNMGSIKSTQTNSDYTLYGSSVIPVFYYGLSMRLKL